MTLTRLDGLLEERPGAPRAHCFVQGADARPRCGAYRLRELREFHALTQGDLGQSLQSVQKRDSEIERERVGFTKIDMLRPYVDARGGTRRLEVQVGEEILPSRLTAAPDRSQRLRWSGVAAAVV